MEPLDPEDKGVLTYYDLFGRGKVWRAIDLIAGISFCTLAVVFWKNWLFRYGFAAVGGFFALQGLPGLLWWRRVTIDRWQGRVRVWRGFLLPLWFSTRRLDRYHTVQIATDLRRAGRRYTTYFTVQLTGDGRTDEVTAKRDYLGARRTAEDVAGYLGFDLLDATASHPVRTPAANVGKSLREQVRAAQGGEKTPDSGNLVIPPPPRKSRLRCTIDGSWLFLDIPRQRFFSLLKMPVILGLLAGGAGAAIGFGLGGVFSKQTALFITLGCGGFAFLFGFVVKVLPEMFVRYQIEAHPGGLTVRRRGLIFRSTREIPSAELRELHVKSGRLRAIGRDRIVTFGHDGLTTAEVGWLRDAITKAIAG
jgi:hypothetical protein